MFDGMMPDPKPTDVPESTKYCPNCGHRAHYALRCGTVTDRVEFGEIRCECLEWGTPAASPVWDGPVAEYHCDPKMLELRFGGSIEAYDERSRSVDKPTHEGSVGGIVAFLVGQIAALGPNPAGAKTYELMTLLHAALDPLASPVAGGSARIAEIASRLAAATSGPWRVTSGMEDDDWGVTETCAPGSESIAQMCWKNDAAFIAAAPDDIAYLLKLVPEGWVKVTPETMPPECTVIACDTSRVVHIAVYRPNSDEYRWDCDTYGLHASDVTHWRPLPAPPAAEEERSSL